MEKQNDQGEALEKNSPETFNESQIETAIMQFLAYGEESFVPETELRNKGHYGYFSGSGWAARCLRFHLTQLQTK